MIYDVRSQENFFKREQLPAWGSKGTCSVLAICFLVWVLLTRPYSAVKIHYALRT